MKLHAGVLYSVARYVYPAPVFFHVWIVLCMLVSFSAMAANNPSDLLSREFFTLQNTTDSIIVNWDLETAPTKADHTVLLYAHGPIDSATYFFKSFEWQLRENEEVISEGTKDNLPGEFIRRIPGLKLQEFGLMSGSRVAALTIRFPLRTSSQQNAGSVIDFHKGEIEIRFPEQDPQQTDGFSKALDETARAVFLNYPPLTKIKSDRKQWHEIPYIQNPSIKLITHKTGLYELSGQTVLDQLKHSSIGVDELAVFQNRKPVPRVVTNNNGIAKKSGELLPADRIRFYASRSTSAYSPDVVTWITLDPDAVQLPNMLSIDSSQSGSNLLHRLVYLEEDQFHIEGRKRNEEQNHNWMWHSFSDGSFATPFQIAETVAQASAVIRIHLDIKNDTYPIKPQHVIARINQTQVTGTITHSMKNKFEFEALWHSNALIKNNTVSVAIEKAFQQSNQVHLDAIDISYPVLTHVSNDGFKNPLQTASLLIPKESQSIWGLKTLQEKTTLHVQNDIADHHSIQNTADFETVFFLSSGAALPSPTIAVHVHSDQRTISTQISNQADVLVFSPRKWQSILDPYLQVLQQQSLNPIYIAVEDVYDVFGDGSMSPESIRDCIHHAFHTMEDAKPSYVLLVGDATWDYWGRLKNGIVNELPSYQGDENYAIENWFVRTDLPDDPLPDMVIARIPVRNDEELQTVIQKTIDYRSNLPIHDWLNKTLVLTDNEFEQYTKELLEDWLPVGLQTIHRHTADYPLMDNIYYPARLRAKMRAKTSLAATEDILNILGEGVFLWQFFGHGAPNVMGNERLFFGGGSKFSDVKKLTANHKPHVLWSFSCETTRFDYPHDKWNISIGEDLLTLPNGGAIALMGAAGRGYPQDHIALARGLHEAAFDYDISTFGLQYYTGQLLGLAFKPGYESVDQFAIFGDPALPMPKFETVSGSIKNTKDTYQVSFDPSPDIEKPVIGNTWWQNEDHSQFEMGEGLEGSTVLPVDMGINQQYLQNYYPGKIGFHVLSKQNGRIHVRHGAAAIPNEKPASAYIAPSTGILPDLTWHEASIKRFPAYSRSGETLFIEAELKNTGKASARNISVQGFKVSLNGSETPLEAVVGKKIIKIDELNPGDSHTIKLRWDGTDNAGEHKLRIKVDPGGFIKESDEENNASDIDVYVQKKADLVINPELVDIEKSSDGQKLMVSFQVKNIGESIAERVKIEFKLILNGSEIILNFPVDPNTRKFVPGIIEVGGAYPENRNPVGIPAAIESFTITVDPDEIVDEESYENNMFTYSPN